MAHEDIAPVASLQRLCFPQPFPQELLWQEAHLIAHRRMFAEGQFVAIANGVVVGSASATRLSETTHGHHRTWDEMAGGFYLETFDPNGPILFGLDISVHPGYRRSGVARKLYEARFELVRRLGLKKFATTCRVPDFNLFDGEIETYARNCSEGSNFDRTLSPLLSVGLVPVDCLRDHMEDAESRNCAVQLEWTP